MRTTFLLLLFTMVACDISQSFTLYKTQYRKSYSPEEEPKRLAIFKANLEKIKELNKREGGEYPPYGITADMDMSEAEFKAQYLSGLKLQALKPPTTKPKLSNGLIRNAAVSLSPSRRQHVVAFNASTQTTYSSICPGPCCTPIQNQGICGDCWAFSAAETLESQTCMNGGPLVSLSPQELADCTNTSDWGKGGCQGGDYRDAWSFAQVNGVETLSKYPITSTQTGVKGDCRAIGVETGRVSGIFDAGTGNEHTMLANSHKNVIAVTVDASNWQFYDGGRSFREKGDPGCTPISTATCTTKVDHAVEIVGDFSFNGGSIVDGWVLRNHWGSDKGCSIGGEGGYFLVTIGTNTCGIASSPYMVAPAQ
jgi:cysteine peptidase B